MPGDNAVFEKPPVSSIGEAIERLEEITQYINTNEPRRDLDGLGCFNYLYTVITKRVQEGVDDGFFIDKLFLSELDVAFANRYLNALRLAVTDEKSCPRSWHVLIERRNDERIESIQFAVAGVNAHINFDLSLAVVETCMKLGTDVGTGSQHDDYLKVNDIFSQEMQALREHYMNSAARAVDNAASPVLNVISDWSVEAARDAAWEVAEHLSLLKRIGISEKSIANRLDRMTAMASHLLLAPLL